MGAESKLQSKIIKLLEADGWIVVKTIQLSKNGFPDIFAFKSGVTMFFEVKAPNGIRSEIQKYRIKQLREQGFIAEFIDNIEHVKSILR